MSKFLIILAITQLSAATFFQQPSQDGNQYFQQGGDGSYKYGYDTGTGGFQKEERGSDGSVSGNYGFSAPGGGKVNVQYSSASGGAAGSSGFSYSDDSAGSYSAPSSYSGGGSGFKAYSTGATSYSAKGAASSSGSSNVGGQGNYMLDLNADGTYTYTYSLPDQSKAESMGADGRVKGEFSFTAPDGVSRSIKYKADEGGFQPEGDHIPRADDQSSGLPSYNAPTQSNSFFQRGNSANQGGRGGTGELRYTFNPSGTYSYSYNLADQAKSETKGADGNVVGEFNFVAPDGVNRAIKYTAGEQGFIAEGDHIPQSPEVDGQGSSAYSGSSNYGAGFGGSAINSGGGGGGGAYSFNYNTGDMAHSQSSSGSGVQGQYSVNTAGGTQSVRYQANGGGAQSSGTSDSYGGGYSGLAGDSGIGNGRGSYSFNYDAGSHGQSETKNTDGSVQGQYSVNSQDGNQASTYQAGKDGFMASHSVNIKVGGQQASNQGYSGGRTQSQSFPYSNHGSGLQSSVKANINYGGQKNAY